jgi:hypothetical protein
MKRMDNGEILTTCMSLCVISITAKLIFMTLGTGALKLKLLSIKYKLYFAWNLPRYDAFCQHHLHPFISSSPQSCYSMPLSCDVLRYLNNLSQNSLHCLCRFKPLSKKHPRTSSWIRHSQKCHLQVTATRHDIDIMLTVVGVELRI